MNQLIQFDDLVDNPTPRVPVVLCLDCSGSMNYRPSGSALSRIDELNKGVKAFYEEIYADEIARYSAEICIVTFGPVQVETTFQTLDVNPNPPMLRASGKTPMGEAVKESLDILEKRKKEYQDNGVDYYQPWLVLMTDGHPEGGSSAVLSSQADRVAQLVENRKLTVFPIAIGDDADMATLRRFSPSRPPLKLQGLKFKEFFSWLSKSVSRVSQSTPGDNVPLDTDLIKSWAQI